MARNTSVNAGVFADDDGMTPGYIKQEYPVNPDNEEEFEHSGGSEEEYGEEYEDEEEVSGEQDVSGQDVVGKFPLLKYRSDDVNQEV